MTIEVGAHEKVRYLVVQQHLVQWHHRCIPYTIGLDGSSTRAETGMALGHNHRKSRLHL